VVYCVILDVQNGICNMRHVCFFLLRTNWFLDLVHRPEWSRNQLVLNVAYYRQNRLEFTVFFLCVFNCFRVLTYKIGFGLRF
jgi:hypothetical protein